MEGEVTGNARAEFPVAGPGKNIDNQEGGNCPMKRSMRLTIPATLIVTLATFGCAQAPEAEKKAAAEAVSAAKAAGAEKYAPSDFAAAAAALKAAEDQMAARKYGEAKTAYVKAKEQADKAAKAGEAGKAAMKSQVNQQLAEMGTRWRELEGKVRAAGRKFKPEQKQAWETDAKATAEALQAAQAAAGDDPAMATEHLARVVQILEKWEVEVKSLTTSAQRMKSVGKKEQPAASGEMTAPVKAAYTFLLAWAKGEWDVAKTVATETVALKVGGKEYAVDVGRGKAEALVVLPFKGISTVRQNGEVKGVTVDELTLKVGETERRGKGMVTLQKNDGQFLVSGLTVE